MLEGKYINPYKLEIIFGNHEKTLVALAALGGLTLVGCDNPGEVELISKEYEGKVTITFVQEVRDFDADKYRLEIRDSAGAVPGYIAGYKSGTRGRIYLTPDKMYDINEKGARTAGVD